MEGGSSCRGGLEKSRKHLSYGDAGQRKENSAREGRRKIGGKVKS